MSSTFGACKTDSQIGFRGLTFEQEHSVARKSRRSLVWPGAILAGLTLGGYVFTAWPEADTPAAKAQPVRVTPRAVPGNLVIYELESTLLVDSLTATATPERVDAH
jgi:hypothetical protein